MAIPARKLYNAEIIIPLTPLIYHRQAWLAAPRHSPLYYRREGLSGKKKTYVNEQEFTYSETHPDKYNATGVDDKTVEEQQLRLLVCIKCDLK